MTEDNASPEEILKPGMAFWASKALLSAVELGVFTALAAGPLSREELEARLDLHPRGARDFLDTLVALGMLDRRDGRYANTPASEKYLDRGKRSSSTLTASASGCVSWKDFFKDLLPSADVIVMGHILHDWDLAQKLALVRKAHGALAPGGRLLVYDAIIDDERRQNAFGLPMGLNMLIETPGGFDYTGAEAISWMRGAGFRSARVEALPDAHSMVIATK